MVAPDYAVVIGSKLPVIRYLEYPEQASSSSLLGKAEICWSRRLKATRSGSWLLLDCWFLSAQSGLALSSKTPGVSVSRLAHSKQDRFVKTHPDRNGVFETL